MSEIFIDRVLPSSEAADALHAALKTALGDKCDGIRTEKGKLYVILNGKADAEDSNTALQVALIHDFRERTPEQVARAERKQQLTAARVNVRNGNLSKDEIVNYLLLEIADLRERLGE